MKNKLLVPLIGFIFLGSLASGAGAKDFYVRKGATGGSNNGSDWNNAWTDCSSIKWGGGTTGVNAGDTVWFAGGTYTTTLIPGVSGNSGAWISIKRVRNNSSTDSVPMNAPGWNSSYDSQVNIDTGNDALDFNTLGLSYIMVDGRIDNGFRMVTPNSAGNSVSFNHGANHITLQYIDMPGPGGTTPVNMNGDNRGIDITAWNGSVYETVSDLIVSHCNIHGQVNNMWLLNVIDSTFTHCKLYDSGASNSVTYHANVIATQGCTNITFSFNEIYNWQVEGIMFCPNGACTTDNWYIYGNLWHDGMTTVSRVIESQYSSNGPFYFYNNTVANVNVSINVSNGGSYKSSCQSRNNIYWATSSPTFSDSDYDLSGGSLSNEAHGQGGAANPFTNSASRDYTLKTNTNPGQNLGSQYNVDILGNARTTWSRGSHEFQGVVPPDPTKHCIRSGAPAGGDGTTWDKAWQSLPATLQRGHTYYIASGNYTWGNFNTSDNGQMITIKGATIGDHGTPTGWSNNYSVDSTEGGSQARVTRFNIATSNWTIDGSVGSGASANYGFGVHDPVSGGADFFDLTAGITGITITHFEVDGINCCNVDPVNDVGARAFVSPNGAWIGSLASRDVFDHLYVHDFKGTAFLLGGTLTLQNSYFARMRNTAWQHSEALAYRGGANPIIRYNIFEDVAGTGQFVALYNTATNVEVYGNVFKVTNACKGPDGIGNTSDDLDCYGNGFPVTDNCVVGDPAYNGVITGLKFYNNTIYGMTANAGIGSCPLSSGYDIRNNFWVNNQYGIRALSGTHENNIVWDTYWANSVPSTTDQWICGANTLCIGNAPPANQGIPPAESVIFVNVPSNMNLNSSSPGGRSLAGAALTAPYNMDMNGITRGTGGTWEVGAYEYGGGAPPPPPTNNHPGDADQNMHITLNEATQYGFCWKSAPAVPGGCPAGANLNFATRAGLLYGSTTDGVYHFDSTQPAPACWVPGP